MTELEVTEEEFNEILTEESGQGIVVADFFAEWCMPCLMISPIIEDLAEERDDTRFVKINIEENESLSAKYNVSTIPCIVFIKDGKEVNRLVGNQTSEKIEEVINALK